MVNQTSASLPQVRAVHADYRSSDEEIYQALKRATAPLTGAWGKLRRARRIAIKFNQDWNRDRVPYYQGHRQQLVSDPVARAALRLLREETSAQIVALDVGVEMPPAGAGRDYNTNLQPVFDEFDVPYVDGNQDEIVWAPVPGGGQMFERYPVTRTAREADEIISVQKIKNHGFMGVTLCMKNLFGLMPWLPGGRPRTYYHHICRMPYMLADLARIYNPALNILDGLVAQAGEEWGVGDHPRICNTLIAGDQVLATDACAATLMGHDPQADWLTPPFHRDRNHLLAAAEGGFGTVDLNRIQFESEVQAPIGHFFAKETDPRETVISWRKSMAEQALYYRDHRAKFIDRYAGQYILLQMGEVRWADSRGIVPFSRRHLAGKHPEQSLWLKYVDPQEMEQEHFEVYEKALQEVQAVRG